MDEFGAAFGRVSEFTSRKRMDAPAAPVSRFQYCHLPARTPEFAGGHQTCGTRADRRRYGLDCDEPCFTDRPVFRHPHSGSGTAATLRRLPGPGCSPASSP